MIRYLKVAGKRICPSVAVYLLYIIYYISGYNGAGHNYIQAILFALWNLTAFWEDRASYQRTILCVPNLFLCGFVLFYFFSSIIVGDFIYTLEYLARYLMLYGCFTQFLYYKNRNKEGEMKAILGTSLLTYLLFSAGAIIFYIQNPSAARILASNRNAFDTIAIGGGYAIAFGAAILLVGLFEMLLDGRFHTTVFRKILCLLTVALLMLLIVKTESTITLIAAIAGLMLAIGNRGAYGKETEKRGNYTRKIIGTVLIALILMLILLNINSIGKWLMDSTFDSIDRVLPRRFYRIGEKLYYFGSENVTENYVDTRLNTVKMSWETFLQHPLIGVGYQCGNVFKELSAHGVGTHSMVFDILAQHGIIGSMLLFGFLFTAIKRVHSYIRCNGYIGALLIMMALNPFSNFHGFFVVLVILPMFGYICDNRMNRQLEEKV